MKHTHSELNAILTWNINANNTAIMSQDVLTDLREVLMKQTPKPLAKVRVDYQMDWNVEVDVSIDKFVEKFTEFLELNGWCGGGITRPQEEEDV